MNQLEQVFNTIKSHNLTETKKLLEENPEIVFEVNNDDWGVIHYCAAYGTPDVLRMLVNKFDANIDQFTRGYYTPALLAAKKSNLKCLSELIKLGADTSVTNTSNQGIISFLASNDPVLETLLGENSADLFSDDEGHVINIIGANFTYKIEIA